MKRFFLIIFSFFLFLGCSFEDHLRLTFTPNFFFSFLEEKQDLNIYSGISPPKIEPALFFQSAVAGTTYRFEFLTQELATQNISLTIHPYTSNLKVPVELAPIETAKPGNPLKLNMVLTGKESNFTLKGNLSERGENSTHRVKTHLLISGKYIEKEGRKYIRELQIAYYLERWIQFERFNSHCTGHFYDLLEHEAPSFPIENQSF